MLLTLNYIKEESIYVKKDHPYLMTPRISHVIKIWNESHSEYTCLLTPRTSAELRMESAKVRRTLRFWFQSYYITKELEVEGSWNHYSHINRIDSLKVILFTIWYHLYNLKSIPNRIPNRNSTKSRKTSQKYSCASERFFWSNRDYMARIEIG